MAEKNIKVHLAASSDLAAIRAANTELAKLAMSVGRANDATRQGALAAAREWATLGGAVDGVGSRTVLTAKQIEEAWRRAMAQAREEAGGAAKTVGEVAESATGGVSKLTRAIGMLTSGAGAAAAMGGKLITAICTGGAWEIGAVAIRAFWGVFEARSENATKIAKRRFEDFAKSVEDGMSSAASAFDAVDKKMSSRLSRYAAEIDRVKELTKAEVELAKQMAIANGMNKEVAGRAASGLSAEIDDEARAGKLREQIAAQSEIIAAAEKEGNAIDRSIRLAEGKRRRMLKGRAENRQEYEDSWWTNFKEVFVGDTFYKDTAEGIDEQGRIDKLGSDISDGKKKRMVIDERADAARASIADAEKELAAMEMRRAAREQAAQNEIADEVAEEARKREEADAAAAEKRAEEERKAAAERARLDAQEATRRERERQAELAAKIKDHQTLLAAERAEESRTQSAVSAAESRLQRAWGWYRDKDSMAAQIQEEKADAAARKQYERDFDRLKSRRRDWRTAENLSVDDEAVRRVALAREEKEAAERHLAEIEKNTAGLAQKLDELLQVKG